VVKRNYAASGSIYAYPYPACNALFQHQGMARNRGKQEAILHQIQRLIQEWVMFTPITASTALLAVGLRVTEAAIGITRLT
jgi:hypothetical protein